MLYGSECCAFNKLGIQQIGAYEESWTFDGTALLEMPMHYQPATTFIHY